MGANFGNWANERVGLCAGLLVSTFSRSLALILGLLVVGAQVSFPSLKTPRGPGQGEGKELMKSSGHPAMAYT